MSKAFVNEDSAAAEGPLVPSRPAKPQPITPAGYHRMQEQRAHESDETARARLDRILATVEVVAPRLMEGGGAGFGCEIEVEDEQGAHRTYVLVGPDEVDAHAGRITADSPVGRSLLGRKPSDVVEVPRAGKLHELTIVSVRLPV